MFQQMSLPNSFSSQVFQEIQLLKGQTYHLSFQTKGDGKLCNSGYFSVDGKDHIDFEAKAKWTETVYTFVATSKL
jgi:hypothetical protein